MAYLILPSVYLTLIVLDRVVFGDVKILWVSLLLVHGLLYTALSLLLLRKHKKHIQQFASSTHEIDLRWLEYIIGALAIMIISVSIFNFVFYEAPLNEFMNALVLIVIFFMAYNSLKQKEIFPKDEQERAEVISIADEGDLDSVRGKILPDDRLVDIKAVLNDLMINKEPYLDSELNLSTLAKQLNISSHQLSYVINSGYNENFYGFINKYRVEKAKRLLIGSDANKFSMLGIAFESGFNSKTAFNTTFKKITGKTPSEFKQRCSDL
jgi:AraC-like DNA-binding protein